MSYREPPPDLAPIFVPAVPRSTRRARLGEIALAGIYGAAVLAMGAHSNDWPWFAVVMAATLVIMTVGTLIQRRIAERQKQTDFFLRHLESDTAAFLEAHAPPKLRVGVDFGVPPGDVESWDEEESSAEISASRPCGP